MPLSSGDFLLFFRFRCVDSFYFPFFFFSFIRVSWDSMICREIGRKEIHCWADSTLWYFWRKRIVLIRKRIFFRWTRNYQTQFIFFSYKRKFFIIKIHSLFISNNFCLFCKFLQLWLIYNELVISKDCIILWQSRHEKFFDIKLLFFSF